MGCELSKQLCKTLEHYKGLALWSEVIELKQVLLAISRVRPNNDVTTENDKNRNTGCGNECNQPVFHYSSTAMPRFLSSSMACSLSIVAIPVKSTFVGCWDVSSG